MFHSLASKVKFLYPLKTLQKAVFSVGMEMYTGNKKVKKRINSGQNWNFITNFGNISDPRYSIKVFDNFTKNLICYFCYFKVDLH